MLDATRSGLTQRWTSSPVSVGQGESYLRLLLVPADLNLSQALSDILTTLLDPQVWSDEGEGTREGMALIAGDLWDSWLQDMRPIGWILPNFLATLPDYLLPCEGQTVARADYPLLWETIHPTLKLPGDLIQIPDLRERYLRGLDTNLGSIGEILGTDEIVIDLENLPEHAHDISHGHTSPPHAHGYLTPIPVPTLVGLGAPVPTAGEPPAPALTDLQTVTISNHAGNSGNGNGLLNEPIVHVPPSMLIPFVIVAK